MTAADALPYSAATIGAQVGTLDASSVDMSARHQTQSNHFALNGGKAQEDIVELLRQELDRKNREIDKLRSENRALEEVAGSVQSIFQMVALIIGEHTLSVNQYISHTCLFLIERELREDFGRYLPKDARKAGNQHV
jgi:Geminin